MAVAAAPKKAPITAVSTVVMTNEDITAKLRELGFVESDQGSGVGRIKVDGLAFNVGDEMYISNPKTGAYAFQARILDVPAEYQGVWLTPELATIIGRPEDTNTYCKSRFGVEGEDRKFSHSGADCNRCPIGPYVRKDALPAGADTKCKWRGELSLQILDAQGQLSDETVWTLDLPTTGMIEFKGIGREPQKGHIGEFNFTQLLARMGAESNPENPQQGFMRALTALRLGGVIAEVRSVPTQSENGGNRYNVIQFKPVQILDVDAPAEGAPALESGNSDDLPF